MPSDFKQYTQIVGEYYTSLSVAEELAKIGVSVADKNIRDLKNEYTAYHKKMIEPYLPHVSEKQGVWYENSFELATSTAKEIAHNIESLYGVDFIEAEILNVGDEHTVTDKEDIIINIYNLDGLLKKEHKISLKLYETFGKGGTIQVASGTYISTASGLAFDIVGVGKWETIDGETFTSRNFDNLIESWVSEYGPSVTKPLRALKNLDTIYKPLIYEKYIGDKKWKNVCYSVGAKGTKYFHELMSIVVNHDPVAFKSRLLKRLGLTGGDDVVIGGYNKGNLVVVSTLDNEVSRKKINDFYDLETQITHVPHKGTQGGANYHISLVRESETLLEVKIPFTINKNGAWWGEGMENHRKNVKRLSAGHPRIDKRKEIATSTNSYVRTSYLYG
jgi:hypothetical protein